MARSPLADVRTHTDPINRYIDCPECRTRFRLPRRGIPGGALAAAGRLRGMLFKHLEDKHPKWRPVVRS